MEIAKLPLVSVVIPHYRRYEMLSEAIKSVVAQSYGCWEIIVVDDGSPEEEWSNWLSINKKELTGLGQDTKISYFGMNHCGLAGVVRNFGVEQAKGEYIAFLDSDDLWLPTKLESQINYLNSHPEFEWVHAREIWDRAGKVISQSKQRHAHEGDIFNDALVKCIIGPSTLILKKELFKRMGGFSKEFEIAEDYEFWLRILAYCPVGYVDEPLVVKRAGDWQQLSSKYDQITPFHLKGLESFLAWSESDTLLVQKREAAKKEYQHKIEIYIKGCLKRDKRKEARFWEEKLASLL